MESFAKQGNPLQTLISQTDSPTDDGESPSPTLRCGTAGAEIVEILQEIEATMSKKDNKYSLVTQAALNGLAKHCVKYLHLLAMLPSAASDILIQLRQLCDFYLCSVFVGFVSAEERAKFFAAPNKNTAAAPDLSRDFEVSVNIKMNI
jgi:hypothetical protein